MHPFENFFRASSPDSSLPFSEFANSFWRTSFPLDKPGALSDARFMPELLLSTGSDKLSPELEALFKTTSNIDFSSAEMNKSLGQQADFFLDVSGKLIKNPLSQYKAGDPLNIELQLAGNRLGDQQKNVLQSVLDTFISTHPDSPLFPRTWQDVLRILQGLDDPDSNSAMQANFGSSRSTGRRAGQAGGGGGRRGGDSGGGRNWGGGSAPVRPENNLAPPVEANGKVFPVEGYSGNVQLHHGVADGAADLFAPQGTPVRAMVEGRIIKVSSNGAGGNNITIQQADGKVAYYAHMQAKAARADGTLLRVNDLVSRGEMIGRVGETGNAAGTGSHLHLGVGDDIQNGLGPEGGAGTNFNLTGTLNQVLRISGKS